MGAHKLTVPARFGGGGKGAATARPRSRIAVLCALAAVIAALCLVSLATGSRAFGPAELVSAAIHRDGEAWLYIRHYRVPRTELAILVGAALGLAGCLVQTITRNPLAGPGILGVNSGAALCVVLGISAGVVAPAEQVGLAMLGAGAVASVVFLVGVLSGPSDPVRLLLIGTAIGASLEALAAGTSLLQPNSFEQFRQWAVGSVADRGETMIPILAICVTFGAVTCLALARSLDISAMGDELAVGLGVQRPRLLLASGAVITALCGAATAAAGPIVFIGMLVPHLARLLVGVEQRWALPVCGLLGALLLLSADILGRVLIPGSEIPAGAVSAVIGAPLFFTMIHHAKVRI